MVVLPPKASNFLCLFLEFDTTSVPDRETLPLRDHTAAAAQACKVTGLLSSTLVAARAREVEHADLPSVKSEPFDEWTVEGDALVRLDFCYSRADAARAQACVRVLADLRQCDGVTAVRLALHTMELVEAGEVDMTTMCSSISRRATCFTKNPALPSSGVVKRNFAWLLFTIVLDLIFIGFRLIWKLCACMPILPNCPEGWFWMYFLSRRYEPGHVALFTPNGNQFKAFQAKVDEWRKELGLGRGYFCLMNYPPGVASCVVKEVSELNCIQAKLRNVIAMPKAPADVSMQGLYFVLHRAMMFNNYGKHTHSFQAVPTGFCWDWINFPAAMACAFTISINGVFLCGMRGVGPFVEKGRALLDEETFGPARELQQITEFPGQGWFGKAAGRKGADAAKEVPPAAVDSAGTPPVAVEDLPV